MIQKFGLDLSKWDGVVSFDEIKKYENLPTFCMLRASYGMYTSQKDNKFDEHYRRATKEGIACGAYHYVYATTVTEARKEAKVFTEIVKGKKLLYPLAVDIEDESLKRLGKEKITEIARAIATDVEDAGYYTMLYVNVNWAKNYIDMKALKHFDTWLAYYGSYSARCAKYDNTDICGSSVGMWQYTSTGQMRGHQRRLDMDIAYKDYESIIKRAGLNNL